MKHPFFRGFLVLALVLGLVLVAVYFVPLETGMRFLNSLAPDGHYEALTAERYRFLSRLAGLIGAILVAAVGWMLRQWDATQGRIDRFLAQARDFNRSLRSDARDFLSRNSISTMNKADRWLVLGIMLVAVILRLASLNYGLTPDEAYSYNAFASESFWVTISDYHLPNNHVLLNVFVNVLTNLFGNHLWLIRLPSVVAGVLMVPAGYFLGKRLYGREAGILGAVFVAVFPVLVLYSVLARGYILLSLFTLLTLYMGDMVRQEKNRFAWLLLVVFSALGFYSVPIMLFPFGALYIWLFLSWLFGDAKGYSSQFDFFGYWLASGFASAFFTILLYLPILVNNFDRFFGNGFISPLDWDVFPTIIQVRLRNTWLEWTETIPIWMVVAGVAGLALGLLLHRWIARHKIPQHVGFLIWIAAYLVARRPDMMPRMWLFMAAPMLVWAAGGLAGTLKLLSHSLERKLPLTRLFVGAAVLAAFLYGAWTIPTIPGRWKEKSHIESAALYLAQNLRKGDMVTASTVVFPQLRYYFDVYGVDPDYLRRSGPFDRAFVVLGWLPKNTLEAEAPKKGKVLAIDPKTATIVLEYDDLTIYQAYPAP